MPIRYLSKFTSADESVEVVWPTHRYEYEPDQELAFPKMALAGGHYEYDLMGAGPLVKRNGVERVRFYVVGSGTTLADCAADVDAQIDYISTTCYEIGRGKLWQTSASGERWAWGRLTQMPTQRITVENLYHAPLFLNFERMSDWAAE